MATIFLTAAITLVAKSFSRFFLALTTSFSISDCAEPTILSFSSLASDEKERIVGSAQSEIEKEVVNAKKNLEKDFATSVMAAVKKIVAKEVSLSNHQDTVDKSLDDFRK